MINAAPAPRLVMLVDDDDSDIFISRKILELTGFATKFLIHHNGRTALEHLLQHREDVALLPDIIFLDLNMPEVNGFAFLKEFERLPESAKNKCKIVVLSSSDNPKDLETVKGNKYVKHYFTKPLCDKSLEIIKQIPGL